MGAAPHTTGCARLGRWDTPTERSDMRIHSRHDPPGLDYSGSWEPSAARADGDPVAPPRAGTFARTLVGILIILLVALAIVVIALT